MPLTRGVRSKSQGFSLLEMLVTLFIVGIIVSFGVKSFSALLNSGRTQQVANSLGAALAQARSESIARGGSVQMCGTDTGARCVTGFDTGWLVYEDTDNSNALNSTDNILSWYKEDHLNVTIASRDATNTAVNNFGFNHRGYPDLPLTITINSEDATNTVSLSANGRVSVQ